MTAEHTIPWKKGIHSSYSGFVLEIHVRVDEDGTIRSFKSLQDARDVEVAESIGKSHGLAEAALALFVEGLRQECTVQLLAEISHDPEKSREILLQTPDRVITELERTVRGVIQAQVQAMLPSVARRVVHEVISEITTDDGPTYPI